MKMLTKIFLLLALLGSSAAATAQVFEWATLAQNLGGRDYGSIPQGGTTDPAGNTYVGFSFADSARIGNQRVVSSGATANDEGLHLIKIDSTGRVVWMKALAQVLLPISGTQGLRADPVNGGVFVTGVMYIGARWGGRPIAAAATLTDSLAHGFYGKCDASGALLWTRPLPTEPNWSPNLAVDGLGNCYLSGLISPNAPVNGLGTIGGMRIDTTEAYLVGNNAAGTGEWTRRLHGVPVPFTSRYNLHLPAGLGLNVGPRAGGGCLVHGYFNGSLYFGGFGTAPVLASREPLGTLDDFIATVSPTGTLSWVRAGRLGNTPARPVPTMAAAAADRAGNYYVTGASTLGLNSKGIGVAKYSPAGALLWVTNQNYQGTPAGSSFYAVSGTGQLLTVDAAGEVTILANADIRPTLAAPTLGNFVLTDYQSLVHFDAAGVPQWTAASRFPGPATTYSKPLAVGVDGRGNVYFVSVPRDGSPRTARTPRPAFLLGELTQVGVGVSVARIGTKHNTVRGRLYLDANGNGRRDNGEGAFPQTLVLQGVQATRASLGTFDTNGFFNLYVGAGAYSLAAPVPPLHYALTQPTTGPYTGAFSGYGRVDTARHFGFRPIANQVDLRATLTAYGAARPGFQTRQQLSLDNVGTTTIPAGTATLTLDAQTTFVGSYPSATATGRVVRWNYPAIPPFGRRVLDVTTRLPATVPIGTALQSAGSAPVAADVLPADNTSALTQTVTGSFDPNDISVSYERLSPAQVAARLPLDYIVRFQNMGTDTAFTVVVTDTLDFRRLDLATLQLVAESHPCTWSLSGTGQLVLRFLNIRLPHRARNDLGSQGFVRFRILPKTSLVLGDLVHNEADIFFDYNAPVRTNTATTAVLLPTALTAESRATAFAAYPNPAREMVTVTAELATAGTVRLTVLDALGRPGRQFTWSAAAGPLRHSLVLGTLAPGLYVLRLTLPDGTASSQRLTVE